MHLIQRVHIEVIGDIQVFVVIDHNIEAIGSEDVLKPADLLSVQSVYFHYNLPDFAPILRLYSFQDLKFTFSTSILSRSMAFIS